MSVIIQMIPTARQIQPMGFLGRLAAIRAPTSGKARKVSKKMSTALSPPVPQELGGCMERVAMYSATDAADMASERPASDQASRAAVRRLIPPMPPSCSLAPSVTTPLYRATVFQTLQQPLREALRGRCSERIFLACKGDTRS